MMQENKRNISFGESSGDAIGPKIIAETKKGYNSKLTSIMMPKYNRSL